MSHWFHIQSTNKRDHIEEICCRCHWRTWSTVAQWECWRRTHERPHKSFKRRGIRFLTGRPTSTSRVAANTSRYLAPFFKSCKIYHEFFPRLGVRSSELGCVRREAYYQSSKRIILLGKVCTFPRFITMGKLLAASLSTMDLAPLSNFNFAIWWIVPPERLSFFWYVPLWNNFQWSTSSWCDSWKDQRYLHCQPSMVYKRKSFFLRQHVYPSHRSRVPTGWFVRMFVPPECHNADIT